MLSTMAPSMVTHAQLAVIILAAGSSSRLGQAKQLVKYQGLPLIIHQVNQAKLVSKDVYCVIGCQAETMTDLLAPLNIKVVNNKNWQQGMANSIAAGVLALPKSIDAVMILLVDQWQISVKELHLLQQSWQQSFVSTSLKNQLPKEIVLASESRGNNQQDKIGPPVIFPRCYFDELALITGQQGAKAILHKYKDLLQKIEIPVAFIDLDTPEQLAQLKQLEQLKQDNHHKQK